MKRISALKQLSLLLLFGLSLSIMLFNDFSKLNKLEDQHYLLKKCSSKNIPNLRTTININSANFEELIQLNGIGEKLASRLISYRNKYGTFKTLNDITKVKGIGPKKLEKLKNQISLEPSDDGFIDIRKVKDHQFTCD